jgi:hypothetical protein
MLILSRRWKTETARNFSNVEQISRNIQEKQQYRGKLAGSDDRQGDSRDEHQAAQ